MLGKVNVQFRVLGVDWSQLFSVLIIQNLISAWRQAAQLDLSPPRFCFVRGVKGVIHAVTFLDRVGLGRVIAVGVEVEKLAARDHLALVYIDPLFPLHFLLSRYFAPLNLS